MFTVIATNLKAIALAGTLTTGAAFGPQATSNHYNNDDRRFNQPVSQQCYIHDNDHRFDRNYRDDRRPQRFQHFDRHNDNSRGDHDRR